MTATSAATLATQAYAFRILSDLLGKSDVYQVNVYRLINSYTATITLTGSLIPEIREGGLERIGLKRPKLEKPRRTISATDITLERAIVKVLDMYEARQGEK